MPLPENILGAAWSTEFVDALPDSSFAYVKAGVRKLPYKDASGKVDLPHVRNALARLASSNIPDDEKSAIKTKLQGALKNVRASDDVSLRSTSLFIASNIEAEGRDLTVDDLPKEMMLLRSGNFYTQKYGEVQLSADDLREMKANFEAGIGMAGDGSTGIPVDFAHQSHLNAGAWIKAMDVRTAADDQSQVELWATQIEFSGSGKKAILEKEYKMLSSDFYPRAFGMWADAESGVTAQNVIVGAGFTNRPMFSGNQPVTASDTDTDEGGIKTVIYLNASQTKETSMDLNATRVKAADDISGPEQRFLQANAKELSDDEKKKFSIVEVAASTTKPVTAAEVTGTEGVVSIEASELKGLKDSNTALQASVETINKKLTDTERTQVEASVLKHMERGAIKADRVKSWTDRLMATDDAGRTEILADLDALSADPVLAKEQGGDGDDDAGDKDPKAKIMAMATKLVNEDTEGKLTIQAAIERVKKENPEIVQATAQVRASGLRSEPTDAEFTAAGVNRG